MFPQPHLILILVTISQDTVETVTLMFTVWNAQRNQYLVGATRTES